MPVHAPAAPVDGPELPTLDTAAKTALGNAMGKFSVGVPGPDALTVPHCSIKYPVGLFGSGYFFQPLVVNELGDASFGNVNETKGAPFATVISLVVTAVCPKFTVMT